VYFPVAGRTVRVALFALLADPTIAERCHIVETYAQWIVTSCKLCQGEHARWQVRQLSDVGERLGPTDVTPRLRRGLVSASEDATAAADSGARRLALA
jgi:hypothetical protein